MARVDIFKRIKDDVFIENRIQLYRLHYNYLKTCLKHPKEFSVNKSHYTNWKLDKVKSLTFDRWWSSIGNNLFGRKLKSIKRIRTSSVSQKDNAVVLQIPSDNPVEYSIEKIRDILQSIQPEEKDQRNHYVKLEIYLETWKLKRTNITLKEIRMALVKRRRKLIEERKGRSLAMAEWQTDKFLKFNPKKQLGKSYAEQQAYKSLERQISRYRLNADKILNNVCKGQFPGLYSSS